MLLRVYLLNSVAIYLSLSKEKLRNGQNTIRN